LLGHVPSETAGACGRLAAADGAVAGLSCDGPDGTKIGYYQFESKEALRSWYESFLPPLTPNTGDCAKDDAAEGTWSSDGQDRGRLGCATVQVDSDTYRLIAWTTDDQAIGAFVFLLGDDEQTRQTVFDAWQGAGPK
jgi:hypothetical protein